MQFETNKSEHYKRKDYCDNDKTKLFLSVVVPLFNEEESLEKLYSEICSSLEKIEGGVQLIFVDDASTDNSLSVIRKIAERDKRVHIIAFRRNYGQTAALQAGFDHVCGEVVITMDADLQNDPNDIETLLRKIDEGYDVVCGWRKKRKDKTLRKLFSMVANFLISWLTASTGQKVHDMGCTFRAYRKWIVKEMKLHGEMHCFIPALAALQGATVTEIEVNHRKRLYGKSKYGFERVFKVVLDLVTIRFFTTSATRPMYFFGKISAVLTCVGLMICGLVALLQLFFNSGFNVNSYLLILMMTAFIAVQFVVLGLLGEIIMRFYYESNDKTFYCTKDLS
ncbi:MAG: glycosyltransferase family 2 protein [Candidatus Omnitrophota bacterium]